MTPFEKYVLAYLDEIATVQFVQASIAMDSTPTAMKDPKTAGLLAMIPQRIADLRADVVRTSQPGTTSPEAAE